jgi:hypothetical protein
MITSERNQSLLTVNTFSVASHTLFRCFLSTRLPLHGRFVLTIHRDSSSLPTRNGGRSPSNEIIDVASPGSIREASPAQYPPLADVLYLIKRDGVRDINPIAVSGAKPWRTLFRVGSAPLDNWCIHLGDIVTVCVSEEREDIAKVSDIRRLDDGRYVVVYTWVYTREQVAAELETDGVLPERRRKNLDQRWPADAHYRYMMSTNRTITLWDTAISRAPYEVTARLCHSSIYSTTSSERRIWSVENPRIKWARKILELDPVK